MKVNGKHFRSIWLEGKKIKVIDQRNLPHKFEIEELTNLEEVITAIKDMHVRGAPLIGATAGFGMYLAVKKAEEKKSEEIIEESAKQLIQARPTAVDLKWTVEKQLKEIKKGNSFKEKKEIAFKTAKKITDNSAEQCRKIGEFGVKLIKEISEKKKAKTVNILTHCNAGWLACVDFGTATAPIYKAQKNGIKIHVWVDETRPRLQGMLTSWELMQQKIPHTIIADNTGGHLMQKGLVDLCITGADRVALNGDAANKIGTYLKALAAKDNEIPFYVALPSSTFDLNLENGKNIPIEERNENEIKFIKGLNKEKITEVLIAPEKSSARNFGFDVTPARLIAGLITEKGICKLDKKSILKLFPEFKKRLINDLNE